MVTAVVYFDVSDGAGFEAALTENGGPLVTAPGYRGHDLQRGVEEPNRYLLTVLWDSVGDHEAWQTAHAEAFLGAVSPHVTSGPDIKHFVAAGA